MEEAKREYYRSLVEVLSDILTNRNIETLEHMQYVQGYTWILINQYAKLYPEKGITRYTMEMIMEAALIHDVGKIMLPDYLLNHSGNMMNIDMAALMEHTAEGSKIAKKMFSFLGESYCETCCNICLYHHEKYDGSGYPKGLKGDEIPLEAQIVALADIYDVLVNADVHKEVITKEKAYYMLMNGRCGELSPEMKECLENAKEMLETFSLERLGELIQ